MADKQAVYTVRVDTGNTINDINNFDKALNTLNKDIDKTQSNLNDSTATDDFAKQLDALNKKVEAGGLSMRQLGKVVREYQSIAIAAGDSSPIGQDAIKAAATLTDRMGDIRSQTTALSSDFVGLDTAIMGVQTGAAVFEGVQSAIALTGVENENLVKTMVKLQAVQGVANSINTIAVSLNKESVLGLQLRTAWEKIYTVAVGQSTGAMKLLRIAMISTGIGALVVALGLLIANFDKVTKFVQGAYDKFNKLGAGVKIAIAAMFPLIGVIYGVVKALEYFGVVDDESERKAKKNAQARSNHAKKEADLNIKELKRQQDRIGARYDHEINMAKAAGKDTTALEQKKRAEMLKTGRAILEELKKKQQAYEAELAMLKRLGDADSDRAKKLKKEISETKTAQSDQYKENKKNKQDMEVAEQEAITKANDRAKERKKIREDELAQIKGFLKEVELYNKTDEEREIQGVQEKFAERLKVARKYYKEDSPQVQALLVQQMNEENDIRLKYQNAEYAKTKENNDKKLKEAEELEAKKIALYDEYQKLLMDEYQLELKAFEDSQKAQVEALSESHKLGLITDEEYFKAMEKLEQEYADKVVEINKKKDDKIKESTKKTLEQKLASVQNMIDIAQKVLDNLNAINDLVKVAEENRLNDIKQSAAQRTEVLNQQQQTELAQQNLSEEQKQSINDKYARLKYQSDLKAFQEEDKIKRAQFKRDKALRIAQIAIDTASAIAKAIATYGPPPAPMAIFGIASASAIGIAQAAAVAAQQYQGGTMPQAPNVSGGVGAGASSFSIGTNTQQTNTQQTNTQTSTPSVTSVVVLEVNDFNEVANKVAVQESKSMFG
jgi:hypothetical protein